MLAAALPPSDSEGSAAAAHAEPAQPPACLLPQRYRVPSDTTPSHLLISFLPLPPLQYNRTAEEHRQGIQTLVLRYGSQWKLIRNEVERDPALCGFLDSCHGDKTKGQVRFQGGGLGRECAACLRASSPYPGSAPLLLWLSCATFNFHGS